jgi:hypothetical protein
MQKNDPEELLRAMRSMLDCAAKCERIGNFETADAYGAQAANKLATAIHLNSKVLPLERT